MKIGFYGDSYCVKQDFSQYSTYMDIISEKFEAEIVNSGFGGSSIWDVFLKQFDYNNVPDVCIFCWTHSVRQYHPVYRGFSASRTVPDKIDGELSKALDYFYAHLHDPEKMKLETNAIFYWFDNEILSKLKDKKIIHLWSMGERDPHHSDFNWADIKCNHPDKIKYFYRWKTGVEIRPALFALSLQGNTIEQNASYLLNEVRPNHLEPHKHQMLASWITQGLNEYSDGTLLDFSSSIDFS